MKVHLVTGQAGYGKTRWLMDQISAEAPLLLQEEHQRVLAVSVMHGARRRVDAALGERCPTLARTVTTLDGFALSLVNRWRRGLGVERVFTIAADGDETLFGIGASFDDTLKRATALLATHTVRGFVASTYPLIMIDEFQDCHGRKLELVQALGACSRLLLAADDFQLLEPGIPGCPAVEWVQNLQREGPAEITELATPKRTSQPHLLSATNAVRSNIASQGPSVPFVVCPREGPAAFRILERLALGWYGPLWTGTCALLSPSHDAWTRKVLQSITNQAAAKNLGPFFWTEESTENEECVDLLNALGVNDPAERNLPWNGPLNKSFHVAEVANRVDQIRKARSLEEITRGAVAYVARRLIHGLRTRGHHRGKRVVTTVHGAKNREFDQVFLLWPFRLPPDLETQRRLLYNGLSRARVNAMLLMLGDEKRASTDPVLSLLGKAQPAFAKKTKAKRQRVPRSGSHG
jgi:hypothetical protein